MQFSSLRCVRQARVTFLLEIQLFLQPAYQKASKVSVCLYIFKGIVNLKIKNLMFFQTCMNYFLLCNTKEDIKECFCPYSKSQWGPKQLSLALLPPFYAHIFDFVMCGSSRRHGLASDLHMLKHTHSAACFPVWGNLSPRASLMH